MTEKPAEYKVEHPEPKTSVVYPVPRNSHVVLASAEGASVGAEELLSVVFQVASENPKRKVEYWIRLRE